MLKQTSSALGLPLLRADPLAQRRQHVPGLLNGRFDLAIQRTGRFVQHEYWCILQNGARQGNALSLTTRQLDAAFSKMCVVTLAAGMIPKLLNELMCF